MLIDVVIDGFYMNKSTRLNALEMKECRNKIIYLNFSHLKIYYAMYDFF